MGNLFNNELKVKLVGFKKLTQMELFSNTDESMGTLIVEQSGLDAPWSKWCSCGDCTSVVVG